uniref:Uncharacterized protein n=1 Tax=Rhizophora mucronata TaxID=61149 RepID=A0A2P2NVF0_RHIMU
MSCYCSVNG